MDTISATSLLSPQPTSSKTAGQSIAALDSNDFLKLLITELTNQDPLEPTGNEELLRQISSIRDIELSTTQTESLQRLTSQQSIGSASSLMGQFVTGHSNPDGTVDRGMVVGIRFNESGSPTLVLSNGLEISMDRVNTIESPLHAGEALMNLNIIGVDRRDSANPQRVEGVVTSVKTNEQGEILLELDSGQDLRLTDVFGALASAA